MTGDVTINPSASALVMTTEVKYLNISFNYSHKYYNLLSVCI